MQEIILATGNKHKVEEIKAILKDAPVNIIPMTSFENYPKVDENAPTLEGNAIKKAVTVAKFFNKWALADDTGLEVDFLGGAPGVISAHYAGENATGLDNNKKLLTALNGVPFKKRTAAFKCVIAISSPEGKTYIANGEKNGIILEHFKGSGGFGYDGLFFTPELSKTFAELSNEEKNKISHRAQALAEAKKIIEKLNI
ncbi:MAG: XTP/dITP diphosphatase [Elusimicrobia bacterium]|nr:XTP/dITP diphosphatase [Elusimicrobiota bacterium]